MTEVEIVLDERTGTRTVTVKTSAVSGRKAVIDVRKDLNSSDNHVLVGQATLVNPMKVSEVRPATRGEDAE